MPKAVKDVLLPQRKVIHVGNLDVLPTLEPPLVRLVALIGERLRPSPVEALGVNVDQVANEGVRRLLTEKYLRDAAHTIGELEDPELVLG